jgi:hypothetical protein
LTLSSSLPCIPARPRVPRPGFSHAREAFAKDCEFARIARVQTTLVSDMDESQATLSGSDDLARHCGYAARDGRRSSAAPRPRVEVYPGHWHPTVGSATDASQVEPRAAARFESSQAPACLVADASLRKFLALERAELLVIVGSARRWQRDSSSLATFFSSAKFRSTCAPARVAEQARTGRIRTAFRHPLGFACCRDSGVGRCLEAARTRPGGGADGSWLCRRRWLLPY